MVRLGLLGCGIISEFLLGGLREAKVPLHSVCDVNEARARAAAAPFGARVCTDYDAMLTDLDAVIIALPNFMHFDAAMKAVEAGKHVFCEKPLTTCASDSLKLARAARKAGMVFQVGYMKRFNPAYSAIHRRLGDIGPIVGADINLISGGAPKLDGVSKPPTDWHADVARAGGGFLIHSGSHLIDLMMHFFGRPQSAWGRVRREVSGNEYDSCLMFRMPDDVRVYFHLTTTAAQGFSYAGTGWAEEVVVAGLRGRLRGGVADWRGVIPPFAWAHEADGFGPKGIVPQGLSQWAGELKAFVEGIEAGECLGSSVVDGYCVDHILGEIKRLETEDGPIQFDYEL